MSYCHRYFFCLLPSAILARQMGVLRDNVNEGGTIVANHRLHMTLAISGDYPRPDHGLEAELVAMGEKVDAEPFRLSLDRLGAGYEVVALRPSQAPAGLRQLQRHLDQGLAYRGVRRAGWSFNPHVTLLYRKGDAFLKQVPAFEWEVAEVVLIHSIVGATEHVELGRWSLVRQQLSLAL